MKISRKTQIPDWVVYVVVYGIVFGVSAFVMIRDPEGSTNWVLYVGVIWAVAAGAVKFGWSRLRQT
jgi:protein-S-isoprenylcysteine O-methyltransferase Ste14